MLALRLRYTCSPAVDSVCKVIAAVSLASHLEALPHAVTSCQSILPCLQLRGGFQLRAVAAVHVVKPGREQTLPVQSQQLVGGPLQLGFQRLGREGQHLQANP